MADYRWYVAGALAGLEATAVHHLSREGIAAFSPSVVNGSRQVRLYPGYVFVELAGPDEAGIVNRTRGIHKMLPTHAKNPLTLPNGFVDELRERLAGGGFDERSAEEIVYKFVPEEEILVKTGPFQDHHGRFARYRKGAAVVILALLGREHALEIPLKALAPAHNRVSGARGALAAVAA